MHNHYKTFKECLLARNHETKCLEIRGFVKNDQGESQIIARNYAKLNNIKRLESFNFRYDNIDVVDGIWQHCLIYFSEGGF